MPSRQAIRNPKPTDHTAHHISNKHSGISRLVRVLGRWACLGLSMLLLLTWYASGAMPVAAQSGTVDWNPPFTLSSTPQNSEYPAIVADRFGYVHVFWSEDVDGAPFEDDKDHPQAGNSILYTRWDGVSWSRPVDILYIPDESRAGNVAVHVDADDELHAVWEGLSNFYYSHAPAWQANSAQAWSTPVVVATGSARSRWTSSILSDASGNLHIIYATGGNEAGIYHILSQDTGLTWSSPVKVSEPLDLLEKSFSNVQIITDRADRLHAVWQTNQQAGYGQAVYYARSVDGGQTWSPPLQLRNRGPSDTWVELPYLAVRGESELHLIYVNGSNVGRAHRISTDAGQTWSEPRIILTELEGINGYVFPLVDGTGQMHLIANMRSRDQVGGIYYARWLGNAWSRAEPLVVNNPNEGDAHWTAGTVRLGNELHVVWTQLSRGEIGYINGTISAASQIPPFEAPSPLPPTPVPSAIVKVRAQTPTPHPTPGPLPPAVSTTAPKERSAPDPLLIASGLSVLFVGGVVLLTRLRRG